MKCTWRFWKDIRVVLSLMICRRLTDTLKHENYLFLFLRKENTANTMLNLKLKTQRVEHMVRNTVAIYYINLLNLIINRDPDRYECGFSPQDFQLNLNYFITCLSPSYPVPSSFPPYNQWLHSRSTKWNVILLQ